MLAPLSIDAAPYAFALDPARCALVIIDMQRDFIEPGGFGAMLGNDVAQLRKTIEPNPALADRMARRGSVRYSYSRRPPP